MSLILKKELTGTAKDKEIGCFDFVSIGLSCHAMCLIKKAGLLEKLLNSKKGLKETIFEDFGNPHLLKAVFFNLVDSNILRYKKGMYVLTELGRSLAENIGTILLPFMGYRNLLVKQNEILNDPNLFRESDIDCPAVAEASIDFGQKNLDSTLFNLLKKVLRSGSTICDLGCGSCVKLKDICSEFNCYGLGIEKDPKVVLEVQSKLPKNSQIEILEGDILNLDGVWEDVEIVMVNFVYHDFSKEKSKAFLNSLLSHFPRMQFLLVADIVSFSEAKPSILPGFDYVHGLQGFSPRNYEEMVKTFQASDLNLIEEAEVSNMPNTFIWLLQRSK